MSSKDRQVMRTVYLPVELDEKIRTLAFRSGKRQNDIMVEMIAEGMKVMGSCLYPPRDLEEKWRA